MRSQNPIYPLELGGSGGSSPRGEVVDRDDPRQGTPAGALGGGQSRL